MLNNEFFAGLTYKEFGFLIGGFLTILTFCITYLEFRKNNKVKRAEFLEKLSQEFNDTKMYLAKKILDDFWIEENGSINLSDEELVRLGSEKRIPKKDLKTKISRLLRSHEKEAVTGYGEQKARQSFDDLLDFFTKLEYYLSLNLISEQELSYFKYYLEKCVKKGDGVVLDYATTYEYPAVFRLISSLRITQ